MRKNKLLLLVFCVILTVSLWSLPNHCESQTIAKDVAAYISKIWVNDEECDITDESITFNFDFFVNIPSKDGFLVKFQAIAVYGSGNTVSRKYENVLTRTAMGLQGFVPGLKYASYYILALSVVDKEGKEISRCQENYVFVTKIKPLAIGDYKVSYSSGDGILNLETLTDGIFQVCKPCVVIVRIGGMCPCSENNSTPCTTREGINYFQTKLYADDWIKTKFKIPEHDRSNRLFFCLFFRYINLESGSETQSQTEWIAVK